MLRRLERTRNFSIFMSSVRWTCYIQKATYPRWQSNTNDIYIYSHIGISIAIYNTYSYITTMYMFHGKNRWFGRFFFRVYFWRRTCGKYDSEREPMLYKYDGIRRRVYAQWKSSERVNNNITSGRPRRRGARKDEEKKIKI